MKGSFKLGSIAGIAVFIHWTFSILIAYIIVTNYRAGQSVEQILWSLLFILSIFGAVFLHELGHALAAKKYNVKTKDITILPIGGVARLEKIPEKPKEELVVAIAGPLVNVALALVTAMFITFPEANELTDLVSEGITASNFFLLFYTVNIWLALFNLIPAFPMDGGRILRALLAMRFERSRATKIAARIGQLLAIGFVFIGFYVNPFLIFIGLFILLGAQAEVQFTESKALLAGYTVQDALMQQYQSIDSGELIKTAVAFLLNGQSKFFLITENSLPVGTLSRDEIIKALSTKGENEVVRNVMNKDFIFLEVDSPLEEAFEKMQQQKTSLIPVVKNELIVGALDMENILEFIMVKNAKEKNIAKRINN